MNFFHVLANERVWKPSGGRNLLYIIFRRLRVVPDGKPVVDEVIGGLDRNLQQLCRRERGKRIAAGSLIEQVAANQPAVGLTDFNERLARAMVRKSRDIQTLISFAFSKQRYMYHNEPVSPYLPL